MLRKIFDAFATVEIEDDRYMNLNDFLKAMIKEPENDRDAAFETDNAQQLKKLFSYVSKDRTGLLSFNEFCFLFRLLNTSEAEFEIAFYLFDGDSRGAVTRSEFQRVIRANSFPLPGGFDMDCELVRRFFGADGSGTLSYAQFSQFLREFKQELVRQEFERYDMGKNGHISGADFAQILTGYIQKDLVPEYIRKNIEEFAATRASSAAVSYSEFVALNNVLRNLETVAAALKKASKRVSDASGGISKELFEQVVVEKTGVRLSKMEVDMIFDIFAGIGKDVLKRENYEDFLKIMKTRSERRHALHPWFLDEGEGEGEGDASAADSAVDGRRNLSTSAQVASSNARHHLHGGSVRGLAGGRGEHVQRRADGDSQRQQGLADVGNSSSSSSSSSSTVDASVQSLRERVHRTFSNMFVDFGLRVSGKSDERDSLSATDSYGDEQGDEQGDGRRHPP